MGGDCLYGSQKNSAITFLFSGVKEDLALKRRQSAPVAPRSVTRPCLKVCSYRYCGYLQEHQPTELSQGSGRSYRSRPCKAAVLPLVKPAHSYGTIGKSPSHGTLIPRGKNSHCVCFKIQQISQARSVRYLDSFVMLELARLHIICF
jgi:hypothetical protein